MASVGLAQVASVACIPSTDPDGDGVLNEADLDDDNDGIIDTVEMDGVDPSQAITCGTLADEDADGVINSFDLDSDNDGIPDLREAMGVAAWPISDVDGDGRIDAFSDPNLDGLDDRLPLTGIAIADSDGRGVADAYEDDSDSDEIFDVVEAGGKDFACSGRVAGVLVAGWDSNGNGLLDALEPALGGTPLPVPNSDGAMGASGDVLPDYMDPDSNGDANNDENERTIQYCAVLIDTDADGIPNYRDLVDDISDPKGDQDQDGLTNALETATGTNPASNDTDGDTLADGDEDANKNGQVDEGETDPRVFDEITLAVTTGEGSEAGFEADAGTIGVNGAVRRGGCNDVPSNLGAVCAALLTMALLVYRRRNW